MAEIRAIDAAKEPEENIADIFSGLEIEVKILN